MNRITETVATKFASHNLAPLDIKFFWMLLNILGIIPITLLIIQKIPLNKLFTIHPIPLEILYTMLLPKLLDIFNPTELSNITIPAKVIVIINTEGIIEDTAPKKSGISTLVKNK